MSGVDDAATSEARACSPWGVIDASWSIGLTSTVVDRGAPPASSCAPPPRVPPSARSVVRRQLPCARCEPPRQDARFLQMIVAVRTGTSHKCGRMFRHVAVVEQGNLVALAHVARCTLLYVQARSCCAAQGDGEHTPTDTRASSIKSTLVVGGGLRGVLHTAPCRNNKGGLVMGRGNGSFAKKYSQHASLHLLRYPIVTQ